MTFTHSKFGINQRVGDLTAREELEAWLHVGRPKPRSHFWTAAETMCEFLDFFAGELRARRRALGLKITDRCLLIADSASQHSSNRFAAFKAEVCRRHNVATEFDIYMYHFLSTLGIIPTFTVALHAVNNNYIYIYMSFAQTEVILTGDSSGTAACAVPGGFGAAGAPNDGFHQYYHCFSKAYANSVICWTSSPESRKNLDELQGSVQASLSTRWLVMCLRFL